MTYVGLDGVQRDAITERAKSLYDQIQQIIQNRFAYKMTVNECYRIAFIQKMIDEKMCPEKQAENAVDAMLERKYKELEKYIEAQSRKEKRDHVIHEDNRRRTQPYRQMRQQSNRRK